MLQHRTTEFQRKADQEGEKRRILESEGLVIILTPLYFVLCLLRPLLFSSSSLLHPLKPTIVLFSFIFPPTLLYLCLTFLVTLIFCPIFLCSLFPSFILHFSFLLSPSLSSAPVFHPSPLCFLLSSSPDPLLVLRWCFPTGP